MAEKTVGKTVYDVITNVIVEKLNQGVIPWRKPWRTFGDPRNLISGKEYRGINHFIPTRTSRNQKSETKAKSWTATKNAENQHE